MIRKVDHGDVVEFQLSTALGRVAGVKVSVFLFGGTLIDTGFPRAGPAIGGLVGRHRVEGAIVTHWHEDHSGNVSVLAARGIPVSLDPLTVTHLPETRRLPPYRWAFWGHAPAAGGVQPYSLPDGVEVVATPGHSVDHRAIWHAQTGTLFSGDLILGVRVMSVLPNENPRETLASVRRVLALEPARVFDAHKGAIRDPKALLGAKVAWLEDTIGAIDHLLGQGLDDRTIRDRILGREDVIGRLSLGQTCKLNFVGAVRRTAPTSRDHNGGGAIR